MRTMVFLARSVANRRGKKVTDILGAKSGPVAAVETADV